MDSLGWVYFQRGDYKNAIIWLEKADKASNGDPEVLEHLGDVRRAMGDREEAAKIYKQAIEAEPREKIKQRIEKKLEEMG
jgi:tetratricopeptide (TPR) repeat protein